MTTTLRFLAASVTAFLLLTAAAPSLADDPRCAGCGMKVDLRSRFASKIVQGKDALLFCDVGDLLRYLADKPTSMAAARVQDHRSGEWIRAQDAFYVKSEKAFQTPMGWGMGAFAKKKDAAALGAPMDIAAAMRAVK